MFKFSIYHIENKKERKDKIKNELQNTDFLRPKKSLNVFVGYSESFKGGKSFVCLLIQQ